MRVFFTGPSIIASPPNIKLSVFSSNEFPRGDGCQHKCFFVDVCTWVQRSSLVIPGSKFEFSAPRQVFPSTTAPVILKYSTTEKTAFEGTRRKFLAMLRWATRLSRPSSSRSWRRILGRRIWYYVGMHPRSGQRIILTLNTNHRALTTSEEYLLVCRYLR